MAMRLDNMTESRKYPIPLYLALIAAGLVGNYFKFSILNADFIFGSIFAMLALQFFGFSRGVLAAAIIASYTYMAWNHPYAMITMTAEVAVVGYLFYRKKISVLIADTLYWLFVGIPLGYFCFYFIADLPASNSIFLMTKQAINGIANALVARLIFTGYALRSNSSLISLREILSNLLAFFVICTALIMLVVASRSDFAEIDHRIRSSLIRDSRRLAESLENWLENRKLPVVNLARMAETLSPSQMQPYLEQLRTSDINFLRIALLNKESISTAYSPPVDELGRSAIGRSYADRPFIPTLKRTLQPMLSEVVLSKVGRPAPIVIMIAPVLARGEYYGCVSGILNFDRIQAILKLNTDGTNLLYSLLDKNGNVIVSNSKDQKIMTPFSRSKGTMSRPEAGLSQWVPMLPPNTSTIALWGKSFYVVESPIGNMAEWKLVLEQPVAPFQKMLYDGYTGRFILVFILLVVALAIAAMLSRLVAVTNEQLSNLTHDLPVKLASGATIAWPESGIRDSSNLIANFRVMADALSARFNEIRHLNESLEQRVEEKTQELRKSENEFRSLAESMPQIVWITRPDGWNIYFNQQWVAYTGLTLEESYGHGWNKPFHPDDQQRAWDTWQNATQHGATYSLECRLRRADGVYRWWLIRGVPVLDTGGTILKWFGTCTDIEDIKQAEAWLHQSEEKFSKAFQTSPYAITITRPEDGTFIEVNDAFTSMTGFTREESLADSSIGLKMWVNEEDRQRVVAALRAGQTVVSQEYPFRTKNGKIITGLLSAQVMLLVNKQCILSSINDITERKQAEEEQAKLKAQLQQAQKMESVGRLAGGVAHDFNNMLGVILGHAEIAMDQVDPALPLHADLQEIRNAAQRSADLTRQLLAFARKQVVSPKVLDMNDTISGMLKMLQRLIGEDINMAWLPGVNLWPVKIDPSQIDQLLANLCINARDAIAGVGKVTIETGNIIFDEDYCADHAGFIPGKFVLLVVSDDGCGMDEKTRDKIFEPFFTTKGIGKGTGLGLATVYGIVKQNRGFINVYSELGQGTTFKIYLPWHEGQAGKVQKEEPQKPPHRGQETILLVEDEPSLLELSKRILETLGYLVLAADTPEEAIHLAQEYTGEIHLLMTDVVMPDMNGPDLAKNLLSLYPNIKRLFTSGYTANVIVHHGVLDENVHFVQKPFSRRDLAAKVREVLDQV